MVEEPRKKEIRQAGFTGVGVGPPRQSTFAEFEKGRPTGPFAPTAQAPVNMPPPPMSRREPIAVTAGLTSPSETWKWNPSFVLRGFQREALDAFLRKQKGSIILPTGSGKTVIAARAIFTLAMPTVVVVPSLVLVDQWQKDLKEYANIDAGTYYGGEKAPSFVTISTYQTLFRYPQVIRQFPVVIFDEGDLSSAGDLNRGAGFFAVMDEAALPEHKFVMVITATPPTDSQRKAYMQRIVPVIYAMSIQEGQELGALAPLTILPIGINLTPEEAQVYDEIEERLKKLSMTLRTSNPSDWAKLTHSSDEAVRRAAYSALKEFSRRRQLLAHAENKDVVVYNIARMNPDQRILVFSEAVDALDRLKTYLGQHGVRMETITGGTPRDERRRIVEGFGKTFNVLGSVRVLERGYNVPSVAIGVLLASGRGATQITQRIGRILRPMPGKQAKLYVVYARGTIEANLPGRVREVIRGEHIPFVESEKEEEFF